MFTNNSKQLNPNFQTIKPFISTQKQLSPFTFTEKRSIILNEATIHRLAICLHNCISHSP